MNHAGDFGETNPILRLGSALSTLRQISVQATLKTGSLTTGRSRRDKANPSTVRLRSPQASLRTSFSNRLTEDRKRRTDNGRQKFALSGILCRKALLQVYSELVEPVNNSKVVMNSISRERLQHSACKGRDGHYSLRRWANSSNTADICCSCSFQPSLWSHL